MDLSIGDFIGIWLPRVALAVVALTELLSRLSS